MFPCRVVSPDLSVLRALLYSSRALIRSPPSSILSAWPTNLWREGGREEEREGRREEEREGERERGREGGRGGGVVIPVCLRCMHWKQGQ